MILIWVVHKVLYLTLQICLSDLKIQIWIVIYEKNLKLDN